MIIDGLHSDAYINMTTASLDFITFQNSKFKLREELLKYFKPDGSCYVIAMSRKGPHLLESIEEVDVDEMGVVTEIALPVLMKHLSEGMERQYTVILVDDAVYYGSTLERLYLEIQEYERIYRLNIDVIALVAIRDKESKNIPALKIKSLKDIRKGYGHYFVRQLMLQFRKTHECLEIEFPVIEFVFSQEINRNVFEARLLEKFPDSYKIDYGTIGREFEKLSYGSVIKERKGCQFCKIRYFVSETVVSIAVMSPFFISSKKEHLIHLFDAYPQKIKNIWNDITDSFFDPVYDRLFSIDIDRNKRHSITVIANFILSYLEYLRLSAVIKSLFETEPSEIKLNKRILKYILGKDELVSNLYNALISVSWNSVEGLVPQSIVDHPLRTNYLFEDMNGMNDAYNALYAHNEDMIRNSKNLSEALSAEFFNQDLHMDKSVRNTLFGNRRHLRFGYTFSSLYSDISNFNNFNPHSVDSLGVNKWIDARIDLGCIVPQYILDTYEERWVRVFRPGENEDVVLAHLARYVLFVFELINKKLGVGLIPEEFLQKILAIIHKELWKGQLENEFNIQMMLDKDNCLMFSQSGEPAPRNVLVYLQQMYILTESKGNISLNTRISNTDLTLTNTLDRDVQENVRRLVNEILIKYERLRKPVENVQSIFNSYLNNPNSSQILIDKYKLVAASLLDIIRQIDLSIDLGKTDFLAKSAISKLLECYNECKQYGYVGNMNTSYNGDYVGGSGSEELLPDIQLRFNQLNFVVNIIMGIYVIKDISSYVRYISSKPVVSVIKNSRLNRLEKYIYKIKDENSFSSAHSTHWLTVYVKELLMEMVKE